MRMWPFGWMFLLFLFCLSIFAGHMLEFIPIENVGLIILVLLGIACVLFAIFFGTLFLLIQKIGKDEEDFVTRAGRKFKKENAFDIVKVATILIAIIVLIIS